MPKLIYLNDGANSIDCNVKIFKFPDNQTHVNIENVREDDVVDVECSLKSNDDLIILLQIVNALDHIFSTKRFLQIKYLLAARSDRVMLPGDSFDLEVVAKLINMCGFKKVFINDAHSDISTTLIERSVNIDNGDLIKLYDRPGTILICPDSGASKKISHYLHYNKNIEDVVYCLKERDLGTGNFKNLRVLEPEKCEGKNCLIIDDLCDGGGTFLGIASQIKPFYLTLMVTHGLFSKGVNVFEGNINEIITTNSCFDKMTLPSSYAHAIHGNVEKNITVSSNKLLTIKTLSL